MNRAPSASALGALFPFWVSPGSEVPRTAARGCAGIVGKPARWPAGQRGADVVGMSTGLEAHAGCVSGGRPWHWSAEPSLGVVVRLDVLGATAARDDLEPFDEYAAAHFVKMRSIERRQEVGFAVIRKQHGEHQASAWPRVMDAFHVDELTHSARVLDRVFVGQFRTLEVVSEDFAIHCLNIQ